MLTFGNMQKHCKMQILANFIRGKCHKPYDSRIAHQIKHKTGGRVCERAVNKHAYAKMLTHHEPSWVEWRALRMIWFKILSSWLYKKHAIQYFSIVKKKVVSHSVKICLLKPSSSRKKKKKEISGTT